MEKRKNISVPFIPATVPSLIQDTVAMTDSILTMLAERCGKERGLYREEWRQTLKEARRDHVCLSPVCACAVTKQWTAMDSVKKDGGSCCCAFSGPAVSASCLLWSPLVIA